MARRSVLPQVATDIALPHGPWRYLGRYWRLLLLGIAMLLATNALMMLIPWLLGRIINALRGPTPEQEIPLLAIGMVSCAILQALVRVVSRISLFNAARMAEYDLRAEAFAHLIRLDSSYYRKNPIGDVMSRLTNDVQTIRGMWGPGVLNMVNTAVAFTAALFLMVHLDPKLTLWSLAPFPCIILFGRIFGRKIYQTSRQVQQQLGSISSSIQQDLTGMEVIKNYVLETDRVSQFQTASYTLLTRNMAVVWIRGLLLPVLRGLASLGVVVVIWIGGTAVVEGRLNLGQLIQFNAYLAYLVWPTMALGWMLSLWQRGFASWRRIAAILTTKPVIVGGSNKLPNPGNPGEIEIRNLTVRIEENTILKNISIHIPAGSITAIVGRTGSGKSTLIETLPRFVEVAPNTVYLDGVDITTLPLDTLRSAISYAPQNAFLFSTTIEKNIRFGLPHEDKKAIESASDAASLAKDLASFPNGWNTLVGERGITLSGGSDSELRWPAHSQRPTVSFYWMILSPPLMRKQNKRSSNIWTRFCTTRPRFSFPIEFQRFNAQIKLSSWTKGM